MKTVDALMIGFGKGAKTLAGKLAGMGQTVALVEQSKTMYGGTCINVGCIPSKFLLKSAAAARAAGEIPFAQKAVYFNEVIKSKRALTAKLRQKNYDKLASQPTLTVYDGKARFISAHRVEVKTTDGTELLEAEKIFINTGAVPFLPPIEGIRENPLVYTSEGMMDLEELPERLVIIGGGYIGVEFATMFSGFGSQVSILQDGEAFLPREDRDIAGAILTSLEEKGIDFYTGAAVSGIQQEEGKALVSFTQEGEERRLPAEAVLVATGRVPNTMELNLSAAGIETTPRGAVKVDDKLRTTAPGVWAMGDVTGGPQFTYVSLDDSRNVLSQLLQGLSYHAERREHVPNSVFLSPPYSRVGLSEEEARRAGYEVAVAKMPAAAIPKAQVLGQTEGLLKAVVDSSTGKILGAMLLCEESYEMINLVKLAMDLNADYTVLRDQIYTHPTMSETLNELFGMI